jgi:hypothetical protein
MSRPGVSAAFFLHLWEEVEGLNPVEGALRLAAEADSDREPAELAALPLGRRDALVLQLRRDLVGDQLLATATCPACDELVEFAADAANLLASGEDPPPPLPVNVGGQVVEWRSPDSTDVAAAALSADQVSAEETLIQRCVSSVTPEERGREPTLFPAAREAVAKAMAEADPLAEILVDITCPVCQTSFLTDLDVFAFVSAEIRQRARGLLLEVDSLARAYGWSESEVLALTERRRAAYLQLARTGRA